MVKKETFIMSKKAKLLSMIGVFIVLCGALYGVKYLNDKKDNIVKEPEQPTEVIYAVETEEDTINHMTLSNENGELSFTKDMKEKVWSLDGYSQYPMKTFMIGNLEGMFLKLRAERLVQEGLGEVKLGDYGLDQPKAKVTAKLTDGTSKTILMGNKTPEGYSYYCMVEGQDKIYTVPTNYGIYTAYVAADFRSDKITTVKTEELSSFYMKAKDHEAIEFVPNNDADAFSTFKLVQPYKIPRGVDSYRLEEYLKTFPKITIDDYIMNLTEDGGQIANQDYGFEAPSLELKMTGGQDAEGKVKEAHYLFGNTYKKNDTDYVYFKQVNSDFVYGIQADKLTSVMDADPFLLADNLIYIVNILKVDSIKVDGLANSYHLTMEREKLEEKDEKTGEAKVKEIFYLNGDLMEDKAFRSVYQLIIGLSGDFEVKGEYEVNEADKIVLTYALEEGEDKVITFFPYDKDANFYLTKIEDGRYFAVSTDEIKFLFKTLKAVVDGEWPIKE